MIKGVSHISSHLSLKEYRSIPTPSKKTHETQSSPAESSKEVIANATIYIAFNKVRKKDSLSTSDPRINSKAEKAAVGASTPHHGVT